jgi:hypothetical protein
MKRNLLRLGLSLAAATLLIFATAAPAAAATQTFRDQTTFSIFVPCANGGNGEVVEGIAKVLVVVGTTDDGAGGFHAHTQVKLQGAGLGTETGDTYRFHADIPDIFFDRLNDTAGGGHNASLNFGIEVIGTGSGSSTYTLSSNAMITVNANGVITMEKGSPFVVVETCDGVEITPPV